MRVVQKTIRKVCQGREGKEQQPQVSMKRVRCRQSSSFRCCQLSLCVAWETNAASLCPALLYLQDHADLNISSSLNYLSHAVLRSCTTRAFDVACTCRVITTAVAINERQDTAVPKLMKLDTVVSRFQLLYRP